MQHVKVINDADGNVWTREESVLRKCKECLKQMNINNMREKGRKRRNGKSLSAGDQLGGSENGHWEGEGWEDREPREHSKGSMKLRRDGSGMARQVLQQNNRRREYVGGVENSVLVSIFNNMRLCAEIQ